MKSRTIRNTLSIEERTLSIEHTIDPGFVHKRKIQTILGPKGMNLIDDAIARLPQMADWEREVRIDHIYKDVLLIFCKAIGVRTLEEVLAMKRGIGVLVCSTEQLAPCEDFFRVERAVSVWVPRKRRKERVEFHYSTSLVSASTLREKLSQGAVISLVAELYTRTKYAIIFHPVLMGFPWLRSEDPEWDFKAQLWRYGYFENFIEDFDEFSKVREVERPKEFSIMQRISEGALKKCLSLILGDEASQDWGGEQSDHFTSSLHLSGRRVTAAFLLKGPARFGPMGLNHLGKNNDQIVRLANEPAEVLIIQHCHNILPAVRATLRAFAVQPVGSRRYCLIDGRDSLRLLKAYDLLESALSWSSEEK